MRRATHPGTGLEGAPDIMLLTMAALMVSIVWLVSHADESSLPPIDLPTSSAAALGRTDAANVDVTLRPGEPAARVWLEDRRVEGGVEALEQALAASGASAVTLRADAATSWQDALSAMTAAARLDLPVSVAADRADP